MHWKQALFYIILLASIFTIAYFIFISDRFKKIGGGSELKLEDIVGDPFSYDDNNLVLFPCRIRRPDKRNVLYNNSIWQNPINTDLYLFSAFYDSRIDTDFEDSHFIRIFGVSKDPIDQQYYCQLWHSKTSSLSVEATFSEMWVHNWDNAADGRYYKPYIISCPIPSKVASAGRIPSGVSLVAIAPCDESTVYFSIKPPPPVEAQRKRDFVVCVKGMDFESNVSLKLIEWLELQFLLGASEVTIYVFRVHPNIIKVLQYYQSVGKVRVKFLTLPGAEPNNPEQRSQLLKTDIWLKRRYELIPYNDCFYDHIYTHRFVVLLDLDEAIVPIKHKTWGDLLHQIFTENPNSLNKYASFSAQNVYFFDEFGYVEDSFIPKYMHMTRHVYRSSNFSHPGFSVKSFFNTNTTLVVFNHYTLVPLYPDMQKNALISQSLAQLHHYRATCPPRMASDCENNFMKFYEKDTVLWKYKDALVEKVEKIVQNLKVQYTGK